MPGWRVGAAVRAFLFVWGLAAGTALWGMRTDLQCVSVVAIPVPVETELHGPM
jgi:hypothetical protein